MSSTTKLASRLGRDSMIFGVGSAVTVVFAFVTLTVTTRYLDPADYGELAIYFFFAAMLTLVYGIVSSTGTLRWVFGSAGEEEETEDEDRPGATAERHGKRRALTTGLIVSIVIAAAGTGLAALLQRPLGSILFGDPDHTAGIVAAAAAGGTGAIWRLTANVTRFSGNTVLYAVLMNVRPLLMLALGWMALAGGGGPVEVVEATLLATLISVAAALSISLRNYELAFGWSDLKPIFTLGLVYIPLVASIWVLQNVDIYILSLYESDAEVGLYRLASRIASVIGIAVSAFILAYLPVARSPIFDAVRRDRGVAILGNRLVTYYVIVASWLVLGLAAGADALASIAPDDYAAAAPLIPLLGVGFAAYGLYVMVYRASAFPRRRPRYIGFAVLAALLMLVIGPLLADRYGSYGMASAVIISFGMAITALLIISERGRKPLRLEWWRLGGAVALAGACYGVNVGLRELAGTPAVLHDLLAILLYPVLAIALRIVPSSQVQPLVRILRSLVPRRGGRERIVAQLETLPITDRSVLRRAITQLGSSNGSTPRRPEALARDMTRALRRMTGTGRPSEHDEGIGIYLLSREAIADRQLRRRELQRSGVDPLELHELEAAFAAVRRLPPKHWPRGT